VVITLFFFKKKRNARTWRGLVRGICLSGLFQELEQRILVF
jgi:hypothetical protein